ncbi:hypothetical protein EPI10_026555 [Gossypium australe]|uniref:Uncharacterized protein n=1 Tax=Gossypium australe TaxID=47621 RepID=A0A5B6UP05_9ROSI|nr:hypothetical protein EPI10_026555 [Gossypium australe]
MMRWYKVIKRMRTFALYQWLIGRLLYFTHTQPDIVFSMQHLSQFMQRPKRAHCGSGLFSTACGSTKLVAFCDSDDSRCEAVRNLYMMTHSPDNSRSLCGC